MAPGLTKEIFQFASLIRKLKEIERFKGQHYWQDYPELPRYESVADHTWRLGVLLILLADQLSQRVDLEKALKMVLVHDLPEVLTGDEGPMGKDGTGRDTYAYNRNKRELRFKREEAAAKALFGRLPSEKSKELFDLWLEYEQGQSFESRVVKSLDRIECLLQVFEYRRGNMFKGHLDFTIAYSLRDAGVDPAIGKLAEYISNELQKNYREFRPSEE